MSGLQLANMEFSDMLDVLHYFFEDDMNYSTVEQADAREKTRIALYSSLYNKDYKYVSESNKNASTNYVKDFDGPVNEEPIRPFNPSNPAAAIKPYVPPTRFDAESSLPFGNTLDGPLS